MKQQFDKWYDEDRKKAKPFSTINLRTIAYDAWKASRQSLVIELPEISVSMFATSRDAKAAKEGVDMTAERIHMEGVKTK